MILWTGVVLLGYVWIFHGEWNGMEYAGMERRNKCSISLLLSSKNRVSWNGMCWNGIRGNKYCEMSEVREYCEMTEVSGH